MNGPQVLAAVIGVALGLIGGWWVPAILARLPEPDTSPPDGTEESDDQPDSGPRSRLTMAASESKTAYADLALVPGLGVRCAVAAGLVGALLGAAVGWNASLLVVLPLAPIGVALGYIDWRTTFLPTRIIAPTYPLLVLAVVLASTISGDWHDAERAGIAWAVIGVTYVLLWLLGGMGYGDVRLSGLLGIALGYLGWSQFLIGFVGGFFLGGVGGLVLALLRLVNRRRSPFGPWMLLAALVGAVFGPQLATALGY